MKPLHIARATRFAAALQVPQRRWAVLLGAVLLGGCGGGIYLGWSDIDDAPPTIELVVSPTAAQPGNTIQLSAAASDDYAINRVEFYRVATSGANVYLGLDGRSPYQFSTTLPDTTAGSVSYYAVAMDDIGQTTRSALVTVTVLR